MSREVYWCSYVLEYLHSDYEVLSWEHFPSLWSKFNFLVFTSVTPCPSPPCTHLICACFLLASKVVCLVASVMYCKPVHHSKEMFLQLK